SLMDLSCRAWSANENRYRLRRWCAALHIIKGEREQRICFWVISADRPGRDTMGLCPEAADHAALGISQRFDFDRIALGNAAGAHVHVIHEHDHPAPNTPRYRSSRL